MLPFLRAYIRAHMLARARRAWMQYLSVHTSDKAHAKLPAEEIRSKESSGMCFAYAQRMCVSPIRICRPNSFLHTCHTRACVRAFKSGVVPKRRWFAHGMDLSM